MAVLRLLAVALAVAATGALAVPLAFPSLVLQIDLPEVEGAASHAGHSQGATAPAGAPGAHAHAKAGAASSPQGTGQGAEHAGHGEADPAEPVDDEAAHAGHSATGAGDPGADQVGMQRPRFPAAVGKVPTSPDGMPEEGFLQLTGDRAIAELDVPGSGTLEDPYVFRGIHFTSVLEFDDTDACIEVAESWFSAQLALNWNGQCMWVHHNYITDLRVNENIPRTGYATGGLIEANEIGIVGQLRHFDGEFRNNVVGPIAPDMLFDPVAETVPYLFVKDTRAANVDGFNQGLIHHNTFYGSVDLDLHGHHHGTGFFAPHSHYHGDSKTRAAEHMHDHSDRWTSVAFTDNLIVDPEGYGLRYEDQNHAGDDRTASSESTKELRDPHVHHTDIVLARNTIEGGHLWVDVFNADDTNHKARNPGTLTIEGNTITTREPAPKDAPCYDAFGPRFDGRSTMDIQTIKEVETIVRDNVLTYIAQPRQTDLVGLVKETVRDCVLWSSEEVPAAIRLTGVRDADLLIEGNVARGTAVGIDARDMDGKTHWRVVDNDFPGQAIQRDESVANEPQTR
ncbi:MAG: hypothetical protein ACYC2H_02600 [Thermoplasmatota archaeon]